MALEAGGGANVAGREQGDPDLAFLMLRLTEDLVLPVTTVPGDEGPTADSFILERVGDILLSALWDWQRDSPTLMTLFDVPQVVASTDTVSLRTL